MMHAILRYLSLYFPHTSGRLAYWRFLLFYDNTGLLDLHNIVIAILPTCIYCLDIVAYEQVRDDDDNHEAPFEDPPSPLRVANDCINYWFIVRGALDFMAALDLVLRASGVWGKILLAMDLSVESSLIFLANMAFFFSVGIFVVAALEGFPIIVNLFIAVWILIKFMILNQQEPIEAEFEEDEAFEDDPFHEE